MRSTELIRRLQQEMAVKREQEIIPSTTALSYGDIRFDPTQWQGLAGVAHAWDAVQGMIKNMRNLNSLEKYRLEQIARQLVEQQLGQRY